MRHNTYGVGVALAFLLASVAGMREVDAQRDPKQVLASAKTVDCAYTVLGTGNWTKDEKTFTSRSASLKVSFFNVDAQESSAEIESSAGNSYYIVVRYVGEYLHLIQMKSEGPIYTTTVYAKEVSPGRYLSVHTRVEYTDIQLPGYTSRPEMYLGDCAIGF